jgi:hypothetical protein
MHTRFADRKSIEVDQKVFGPIDGVAAASGANPVSPQLYMRRRYRSSLS